LFLPSSSLWNSSCAGRSASKTRVNALVTRASIEKRLHSRRWIAGSSPATMANRRHRRPMIPLPACGRAQEGEVAPLIRAQNFLRIELGVATLGLDLRGLCCGGPRLQLSLLDHDLDAAFLDREADAVAAAHEAERATGGRIRRDVQHDGAEG